MKKPAVKLERGVSKATGSIRWWQLVDIAFKNLFYKKLRTTLTIMGVIIGVGAVVFLLAFGFGLRDVVTSQVVDSNSIRAIDVESAQSELVKLNQETVNRIEQVEGVSTISKVYNEASEADFEGANIETVLYAVDQGYLDLATFQVLAGSPPTFDAQNQLFINSSFAEAIGQASPDELVGKEVTLTFEVPERVYDEDTGELKATEKTRDETFSAQIASVLETGSGAEVYISSEVLSEAGVENASQLKVLADSQEVVPDVQKRIEALGLVTNSPLSTLDQINQVFSFLNLLFLGFGGIGLIIAVLGMFNTLTISLLERTKEIGLMITLGARKKDIRRLFIVEAVGLSLIGGALGTLTAFMLSRITDVVLNSFARGRGVSGTFTIFTFEPLLLLATFVFSTLLGLLVVYLPAKRAANTNPIEALKS